MSRKRVVYQRRPQPLLHEIHATASERRLFSKKPKKLSAPGAESLAAPRLGKLGPGILGNNGALVNPQQQMLGL